MVELKENFVIFLTLFMLSFSLPKFLLLFGTKLLFMLFILLIAFRVLLSKIKLHMNAFLGSLPDYHHLCSFGSACFVLLQSHEHNKLEPQSRLCCFLGYGETQKGYWCYDPVFHHLRISCNVVFWERRLFVKLFHFCASLSSSSILDLFPDEAHIPSVVAPNPPVVAPGSPVDFSIQPTNILDHFPSSPFNEHVEDEQVEDELPNPELGSLTPASPEDHA